MTGSTPRPAATVIVTRARAAGDGFEVLMVRRSDSVAFMAGAYVFPGGRVDDEDLANAHGDQALAFRIGAARELEEEAAVCVDVGELIWIAHWITPEVETRRYDTRFFLAPLPPGQDARHDAGETTELAWLTPAEAIDRCRRGEILLPPPTWTTLKRLQRHRTIDEAFAWARSVAIIPPVEPHLLKDEHQTMLVLPGDPTYPTVEGWEIPEDTRFLLQEGRWRPVKA